MSIIQITIDTSRRNFCGGGGVVDHEIIGREVSRCLTTVAAYFADGYERDVFCSDAPSRSGLNIEVYG